MRTLQPGEQVLWDRLQEIQDRAGNARHAIEDEQVISLAIELQGLYKQLEELRVDAMLCEMGHFRKEENQEREAP